MIEARGLSKRYGGKVAVDGLSFTVRPGHVTGFLGPNGAGKTTTMRMILGLDRPTGGSVTVNGRPFAGVFSAMREVGALLDAKAVHGGRSAYSHLLCLAQTNAIPRRRVEEVLGIVGLADVARKRSKGFSLGMRRPGLAETLRSELTKIRSVRSTYWTLIAQVVASVAWAIADCEGTVAHWSQRDAVGFDAAQSSLLGQVELGEVIIVVLGALVMTSEYSTGMIRTSLAVMPRRGVLYAAKALVLAAVSFAVSLAASFAAFFTGQAILAGKHIDTTLARPDVLRAVLLSAAVVTVFGLFAYGAGALIRHTAGAITAILGVLFLLPVLGQALPASWYNDIVRWLPGGTALGYIASSAPPHAATWPSLFSAWGEFAVFCGYAAVLLAAGAWSFLRRDA